MEEQKVYLLVETPFSLKKPKGFLILPMLASILVYPAIIGVAWMKVPERIMVVAAMMSFAAVLSAFWVCVFRFSYVTLDNEHLVCKCCGVTFKRIYLSNRLQFRCIGGQLRVMAGSAVLLRLPDSDAARRLLATARISVAR